MRRAKATANYLDKRTIYIDDDELICGNCPAKPWDWASCWGPFWDDKDLDSILEGNYTISDGSARHSSLDSFWEGQSRQMYEWQGRFYDDFHLWPFIPFRNPVPAVDRSDQGPWIRRSRIWMGTWHWLTSLFRTMKRLSRRCCCRCKGSLQEELEKLRYNDNDSFDKGDYLRACIIALTAMQRMYHAAGIQHLQLKQEGDCRSGKKSRVRAHGRHLPQPGWREWRTRFPRCDPGILVLLDDDHPRYCSGRTFRPVHVSFSTGCGGGNPDQETRRWVDRVPAHQDHAV